MTKPQQIQAFITKNSILSTAVILLFVGTTTVSAMEVFNTPESKPSRILGINRPSVSTYSNSISSSSSATSSNSNTSSNSSLSKAQPLVADSEHDVVVIEECDLAVKYKKDIDYKTNLYTNFEYGGNLVSYYLSSAKPQSDSFKFTIACDKNNFLDSKIKQIGQDSALSKPNVNDFCTYINSKICQEYTPLLASDYIGNGKPTYYFQRLGTFYSFNNYDNVVEIQPNSLAPSKPSVILEKATQNQAQDNYNIFDLREMVMTFSKYTKNGLELYACGASCTTFLVNKPLDTMFEKPIQNGQKFQISGKIKSAENIKISEIVEITEIKKLD